MAIQNPSQRKTANKKGPAIPTRAANPTPKTGPKNSNGPKGGSSKTSLRFNRAKLYAAKGEKII
jgi:hypothetical protein